VRPHRVVVGGPKPRRGERPARPTAVSKVGPMPILRVMAIRPTGTGRAPLEFLARSPAMGQPSVVALCGQQPPSMRPHALWQLDQELKSLSRSPVLAPIPPTRAGPPDSSAPNRTNPRSSAKQTQRESVPIARADDRRQTKPSSRAKRSQAPAQNKPNGNLCRLRGRAIGDRLSRETKLEVFGRSRFRSDRNRAGTTSPTRLPASRTTGSERGHAPAQNKPNGNLCRLRGPTTSAKRSQAPARNEAKLRRKTNPMVIWSDCAGSLRTSTEPRFRARPSRRETVAIPG
jgi:hypothetical protein